MQPSSPPTWMGQILKGAAVTNILWGGSAVIAPGWWFYFAEMEPPKYLFLVQGIGMVTGVFGIGYWIASGDVIKHRLMILTGLIGKSAAVVGFLYVFFIKTISIKMGLLVLANDLIWCIPFYRIINYRVQKDRTT